MRLVIENPALEKRAATLAASMGVRVENAIDALLKDALGEIIFGDDTRKKLRIARTENIIQHYKSLPIYDKRTDEEILGYNDLGLPE